MTLRMYARRKGLPLDHVRVTLGHERTHAEDCERSATETCMVGAISRRIELVGDLDDGQRAALVAIADKCPVHRTLEGTIRVTTTSS